ncbi:hypothetical protein CPB85DRAFT_1330611 [Mucidula mucida]|nr:hypothetical protein CPB85DRAFT_1258465 [Mucidula mucida]KAF8893640.1 hypothetical protein CPB85DRAFT_1330611 [Mucidula mucida]
MIALMFFSSFVLGLALPSPALLDPGSYRISSVVTNSTLVAPKEKYQNVFVRSDPAPDVWMLGLGAGGSFTLAHKSLALAIESEDCEAAPLILAPLEESSAFVIEAHDSVDYFTIRWPNSSVVWTAQASGEVQLRKDAGTEAQRWMLKETLE